MLSVPTIDVLAANHDSLTPSIYTVFQQVPDKKPKHFPKGSYIVREGEQMTGFYLIKARNRCCTLSQSWMVVNLERIVYSNVFQAQ